MSCPACRQPLVIYELDGVEIDHCIACRGTWLDAGELELIGQLAGADRGALSEAVNSLKAANRGERPCPRCRRKMDKVLLAGDAKLELDRCRLGHGLWFDQGELKRALAIFEHGEAGAVAAFFSELYMSELAVEIGSSPLMQSLPTAPAGLPPAPPKF